MRSHRLLPGMVIMDQISEAELSDIKNILETFRPVAEQMLSEAEVTSLMAYMAHVVHSEFYSDEVKIPWPDYVIEEDREIIRNAVRKMLNSLIAKRFLSEMQRILERGTL